MKQSTKIMFWRKVILLTGIIIIGVFCLNLLLSFYLKSFLTREISKYADTQSNGEYHVGFEKLKVNLFNGTIAFEDLYIQSQQNNPTASQGEITIKELKIIRPLVSLKGKFPEKIIDFGLSINGFKYTLPDTFFTITFDEAAFQWQDSTLRLDNFAYSTSTPKMEFAKMHPKHKNWEDFSAKEIILENITIRSLLNRKEFFADKLRARNAVYQTFENKKYPKKTTKSTLYSQKLREIPYHIKIDSVLITGSGIRYDELGPERIEPGVLTFTDLSLKASNFTNIQTKPNQTNTLDVQTKLLGSGKLEAQFILPLDSASGASTFKANLGPMPLIAINPVLSPLELIKIDSGITQELEFEMKLGEERSSIDIKFLYQDLSVSLYSIDEENERAYINPINSFFAKGFIKKSNPLHPGDKVWEHAEYERDPYRSVFNYLWKTLLQGLMASALPPHEALIEFAMKNK